MTNPMNQPDEKHLKSLAQGWENLSNGFQEFPENILHMMKVSYYAGALAHSALMYNVTSVGQDNPAAGKAIMKATYQELMDFRTELSNYVVK